MGGAGVSTALRGFSPNIHDGRGAGKGRGRPCEVRPSLLCLNRAVIANSRPLRDCRAYTGEGAYNSETAERHLAATAVSVAATGLFLVLRGTGMAAWIREGRAGQMRDGHCCLPVRRMLWSNSRAQFQRSIGGLSAL